MVTGVTGRQMSSTFSNCPERQEHSCQGQCSWRRTWYAVKWSKNSTAWCLVPITLRISPDVVKFGSTSGPKNGPVNQNLFKDQFHLDLT